MLKVDTIFRFIFGFAAILMVISCNKDDDAEEQPVTGTIEGVVTEKSTAVPLEGVRITVFDANTNAPAGPLQRTDSAGKYILELHPGSYQLKLSRLGYLGIPIPGMPALPFDVTAGKATSADFQMMGSAVTNGGVISGMVTSGGNGMGGVLVVAENDSHGYSSVTDGNGVYFIVNIVPGNYEVSGWHAGYSSSHEMADVGAGEEIENVNIEMTADAVSVVSGAITFLATQNIEVDVALVHPKTRETIPGLSTVTTGQTYTIPEVPDGTFLGRASFRNDEKVVDPDWIVKNGEPFLTVSGADLTMNFSVTGAVHLVSPTNPPTSTVPVEVGADGLQFNWEAYPSASDYVVEVMDANGNVIWGGFSDNWSTKNVVIPDSQTSVLFNFDGSASESLQPGHVYRWRIFASKDDNQSATGWRLISASEDQLGLIRIPD